MSHEFFTLTPERVLDSVEAAVGTVRHGRATGNLQALNSIENRVYQVEMDDGTWLVTKFYRPGRWTPEQIADEHRFTTELARAEVPSVAPLDLDESENLGVRHAAPALTRTLAVSREGICFAVFPRLRGRLVDELNDERLRQVGRFVARLHAVGARVPLPHRNRLDVETMGKRPLEFLLASPFFTDSSRARYQDVARRAIAAAEASLERGGKPVFQAIHGDCHVGNILWDQTGPFFVDFDDCVLGPPVQDIWMIVRGRGEEADRARETLLEGYEQMREFDRASLRLVEPLRALRLVHYAAWIAKRWDDPSFPRIFPLFGSERYWQEEIEALGETLVAMESAVQ